MKNKTITLQLSENEAARLWDFLAILRSTYTFKDGRDLKLVTAIHDKLKKSAKESGVDKG